MIRYKYKNHSYYKYDDIVEKHPLLKKGCNTKVDFLKNMMLEFVMQNLMSIMINGMLRAILIRDISYSYC